MENICKFLANILMDICIVANFLWTFVLILAVSYGQYLQISCKYSYGHLYYCKFLMDICIDWVHMFLICTQMDNHHSAVSIKSEPSTIKASSHNSCQKLTNPMSSLRSSITGCDRDSLGSPKSFVSSPSEEFLCSHDDTVSSNAGEKHREGDCILYLKKILVMYWSLEIFH